ncbi:MAG TPA: hypothetical protein VFO39_22860 [Candidatus Sulfotelmatobacter sp.]|nr:hypothetical protein [Candidatus Sulfotelmatobacter sp.]
MLVVVGFAPAIPAKSLKSSIRATVGVAHEEESLGSVQQNRHTQLLEDEISLEIIAGRGKGLGAASDHNHVWAVDLPPAQEFVHRQPNALIEAAEHCRISYIRLGG